MARGNRKATIFEDRHDRVRFIEILAEAAERHRVQMCVECRMGNHFHVIVRTPEANISEFMGYLNGVFAQYSNHRHKRSGHLFGDRFKPILIDNELYFRVAVGYVVMNPVNAGLVNAPDDWQWSSYRSTVGLAPVPSYLCLDWLDTAFQASSREESQEKLCDYLKAPSLGEAESWLDQPAVGPPTFARDVRTHIGLKFFTASVPRSYRALDQPPLETLFAQAWNKEARGRAMLRAHVIHGYRMSEIARFLDLHPSSVSRIVSALRRQPAKL
jgi:putative transposase